MFLWRTAENDPRIITNIVPELVSYILAIIHRFVLTAYKVCKSQRIPVDP